MIGCEALHAARMLELGWSEQAVNRRFRNRRDGDPPSDEEPVVYPTPVDASGIVAYASTVCVQSPTEHPNRPITEVL